MEIGRFKVPGYYFYSLWRKKNGKKEWVAEF